MTCCVAATQHRHLDQSVIRASMVPALLALLTLGVENRSLQFICLSVQDCLDAEATMS